MPVPQQVWRKIWLIASHTGLPKTPARGDRSPRASAARFSPARRRSNQLTPNQPAQTWPAPIIPTARRRRSANTLKAGDAGERARRQDRLQRAEAAFDPLPFGPLPMVCQRHLSTARRSAGAAPAVAGGDARDAVWPIRATAAQHLRATPPIGLMTVACPVPVGDNQRRSPGGHGRGVVCVGGSDIQWCRRKDGLGVGTATGGTGGIGGAGGAANNFGTAGLAIGGSGATGGTGGTGTGGNGGNGGNALALVLADATGGAFGTGGTGTTAGIDGVTGTAGTI